MLLSGLALSVQAQVLTDNSTLTTGGSGLSAEQGDMLTADKIDCNRVPYGAMRRNCFAEQKALQPKAEDKTVPDDIIERAIKISQKIQKAKGGRKKALIEELEQLIKDNPMVFDEKLRGVIARYNQYNHYPAVLPFFYIRKGNTIKCPGFNGTITIVGASQYFVGFKSYLILEFKRSSIAVSEVPTTFINRNMRQRFAVYDNSGDEVAFFNGKDLNNDIRYRHETVYTVGYQLGTHGWANDIKCAKRQFDRVLDPSGEYKAPKLEYDIGYLRAHDW